MEKNPCMVAYAWNATTGEVEKAGLSELTDLAGLGKPKVSKRPCLQKPRWRDSPLASLYPTLECVLLSETLLREAHTVLWGTLGVSCFLLSPSLSLNSCAPVYIRD